MRSYSGKILDSGIEGSKELKRGQASRFWSFSYECSALAVPWTLYNLPPRAEHNNILNTSTGSRQIQAVTGVANEEQRKAGRMDHYSTRNEEISYFIQRDMDQAETWWRQRKKGNDSN